MKLPLFITILAAVVLGGMTGCEQEKGPAEKAGEKLDEAVDSVKKAVDE